MARELVTDRVRRDWPQSTADFDLGVLRLRQVHFRVRDAFLKETEFDHEGTTRTLVVKLDVPDARDGEPAVITFNCAISWEGDDDDRRRAVRGALHHPTTSPRRAHSAPPVCTSASPLASVAPSYRSSPAPCSPR